jgi:hypothetical protein
MREPAMDKQVGAALVSIIAQSAGRIMRPSALLQNVSSETSFVYHESHEKFALHGSLGPPDRLGAGKEGVGHEIEIVGRFDSEHTISRATPDELIRLSLHQIGLLYDIP